MTTKIFVLIAICCCLVLMGWPVNAGKFWNRKDTSKETTASEEQQEIGQPSAVKLDQQPSEEHQPGAERYRHEEHHRFGSEEHRRFRPESPRFRPNQQQLSGVDQQYHQSLEILAAGTYSSQEEAQAALRAKFPGSNSSGNNHEQSCSRFDVEKLRETDKRLMAENPELKKAKQKFAREISSEGEDLECATAEVAGEPTKLSKLLGQTAEKTKQVGRWLTKIFTLKNGKRALFIMLMPITVPLSFGVGAAVGGTAGFGIGIVRGCAAGWKFSTKKAEFPPLCLLACPFGMACYAAGGTLLLGVGGAILGGVYTIGGSIDGFDKANEELSKGLAKW